MKVRDAPEPVFLSVALVVSCWVEGLVRNAEPQALPPNGGAVGVAPESAPQLALWGF